MLDQHSLPWIKEIVKAAQQPIRGAITSAKKTLEPVLIHPSAFAKTVRFSQGFQEPAEVNDEYLEMTAFSTC